MLVTTKQEMWVHGFNYRHMQVQKLIVIWRLDSGPRVQMPVIINYVR